MLVKDACPCNEFILYYNLMVLLVLLELRYFCILKDKMKSPRVALSAATQKSLDRKKYMK